MKPKLIDRSNINDETFGISYLKDRNFFKVWHYHPELELVVILESSGKQFVGDSIEKFQVGDVLLFGKNLPHLLLNDNEYFEKGSKLTARAIVINFDRYFTGKTFLNLPELKTVEGLLEKSSRGIKFGGPARQKAMDMVVNLVAQKGLNRMISFIKLLEFLARASNQQLLSSSHFFNSEREISSSRMGNVYNYVMNNFDKKISLKEAAEIAHMNPTGFSRYFKKYNNKNFTQYVNEMRIGLACKLLLEKKLNTSEICYLVGYNNISNFNRQFKFIKGQSPRQYINSCEF